MVENVLFGMLLGLMVGLLIKLPNIEVDGVAPPPVRRNRYKKTNIKRIK